MGHLLARVGLGPFAGWLSLFAPVGTPADIVEALNRMFDGVIKSPAVTRSFGEQSIQPGGGSPPIAADLYRADVEQWPSIIRARAAK